MRDVLHDTDIWGHFHGEKRLGLFSLALKQVWTYWSWVIVSMTQYEIRCIFVVMGLNAFFIVLPHWDNRSKAYMLTRGAGTNFQVGGGGGVLNGNF